MLKGSRNLQEQSLARARRLRQSAGVSEIVLWKLLRDKKVGFKFRRQYPIGPYVLDFFCPESDLAVEVDGELHALRVDRDASGDAWMLERGIETIRIPSLDLFEFTGKVAVSWLRGIQERCEQRTGSSAFPGSQDNLEH